MMGALLTGGISSYLEVFEYYFGKFGSNTIEPIVWAEFTIAIVLGFIIRGYFLIKFETAKSKKSDEKSKKNVIIYCAGHVAYEFLIGYIIAFCLINFTNANPKAFFINTIICPAVGFISGMVFDNKIIMKLEESNNIANMSKNMDSDTDTNSEIYHEETIEDNTNTEGIQKINLNSIESCDAKLTYKIINILNDIIDEHNTNSNIINDLSSKIEILEKIINILKETEKNDKKLELKSLIYHCLNEGYAKPEEDAIITNKYNSYLELVEDKDSEIKSLFENRYLKLGVHEDRRKSNVKVENDRRTEKRVSYGQYDNEISQG